MAPLVGRIDRRGRAPDVFAGTDRFRPLECIGRGSMGTVYRAHDAELDLVLALKGRCASSTARSCTG